jgi:predicted phosphodiesterase
VEQPKDNHIKMKIAIVSDIHLEFGDLDFENDSGADVLILSGDICVARDIAQRDPYNIMGVEYRSNRYHEFFQRCSARFPYVIYIVGNHEHYNGDFANTVKHLKDVLGYLKNLVILDKESTVIDGVTFIGGTLWTDLNREDPMTMHAIRKYMNDYRVIENSNEVVNYRARVPADKPVGMTDEEWIAQPESQRTREVFKTRVAHFSPADSVADHRAMLDYIQQVVAADPNGKFVVVGHHSPSKRSIKPRYQGDYMVNGAYSSDLEDFIKAHPGIVLWTHGHTHDEFDYTVGNCRIVCNPRGYVGHEQRSLEWKLQTVEV